MNFKSAKQCVNLNQFFLNRILSLYSCFVEKNIKELWVIYWCMWLQPYINHSVRKKKQILNFSERRWRYSIEWKYFFLASTEKSMYYWRTFYQQQNRQYREKEHNEIGHRHYRHKELSIMMSVSTSSPFFRYI